MLKLKNEGEDNINPQITINGLVPNADVGNGKIIVGFAYVNDDGGNSIRTFDIRGYDYAMISSFTQTASNYLMFFVYSTDDLTIDGEDDPDSFNFWVDSHLTITDGSIYSISPLDDYDFEDFKDSWWDHFDGQLDSLRDYPNFVYGAMVSITTDYASILPNNMNFIGGSGSVEITYESSEDYTVSPSSPISVGDAGITMTVTLIDGYEWNNEEQCIVIDGNYIYGTVEDSVCSFELNSGNVGSGGEITWDLHYSAVTPPSEDRKDFFTIYEPTNKNMDTINNAIFISGDGSVNLLQYFSGYRKFYCNIPISGYKQLKANRYDFGETAPYVKEHTMVVDCGSVDIEEQYQSLLDYSPFSRLTIYLPFIGFNDLDDKLVMGHSLRVQYVVDILSGRCLAKLYVDSIEPESCIAEYGGTIAADEIFGLDGGSDYYGAYELMTTLQLGELDLYVLIHTKIPLEDNIADYTGLPANEIVRVGDAVGFIKYNSIHVDGIIATDTEKSEIESLLKQGIIV